MKRVVYIDALNVLAIVAVIALHHNGLVHSFSDTSAWYTSLVAECMFYFAVPVFVMISGAMLMDYRKKYDTKTFFRKRLMKVAIPAIFWMFFMLIWKTFVIKTMKVDDWSSVGIMNIMFQSKEESVYYFLFLIMGLYLTMPLLSRLVKEDSRRTLWYCVAAYFVLNAFLPNILLMIGVKYNTDLGLMFGQWVFYAILGYLLSTCEISKKRRMILYCMGLLAIVYRYCFAAFLSVSDGSLNKLTWGYGQFHTILLSSAVFVFVKNLRFTCLNKNKKLSSVISLLAQCSFGVYLVHKLIMYYEVDLLDIDTKSILWRTIGVLLTYAVSVVIVLALKKIPGLRKVVP